MDTENDSLNYGLRWNDVGDNKSTTTTTMIQAAAAAATATAAAAS